MTFSKQSSRYRKRIEKNKYDENSNDLNKILFSKIREMLLPNENDEKIFEKNENIVSPITPQSAIRKHNEVNKSKIKNSRLLMIYEEALSRLRIVEDTSMEIIRNEHTLSN